MYSTDCEGGTLKRADRLRPAQQQHAKITSERSRSLPRHYQQSRLTSASSNLDLSSATYDHRNDTLYATKAVAVILSEPFVHSASQVLAALHKYACKSDYDLQVRLTSTVMTPTGQKKSVTVKESVTVTRSIIWE